MKAGRWRRSPVRRGEYRYDRTQPMGFLRRTRQRLFFAANVVFENDLRRKSVEN